MGHGKADGKAKVCFYYPWSFVCLFGVYHPTWEFYLIWRRHHYRLRAANFDLCSALMAIEQCGLFNAQHLLWHEPSVYNGHLRGPVTLTPIGGAVTACFYYLGLSRLGFEHITFRGANALTHCETTAFLGVLCQLSFARACHIRFYIDGSEWSFVIISATHMLLVCLLLCNTRQYI